jgi:CheY-specific phosphatase CheX
MSVKFFGQFLIEKNVITPEQLIEAVDFQETINQRFGDYAVSKGYLSKDDVMTIQRAQQKTDMMFGDIAVGMNKLTKEQVDEILIRQKNDHVYVGAALVKKGFLVPDDLVKYLAEFKEDQAGYEDGDVNVPEAMGNAELVKDMVLITKKLLYRVSKINAKIGKPTVSTEDPERNFAVIAISMEGSSSFDYIISCSLEASEVIASSILGVNVINEPGEIIADSVKEFANIVCGNIISKFAQRGKTVEISPPLEAAYSSEGYKLVNGRTAVYYPFISTAGEIELILAEGAMACKA